MRREYKSALLLLGVIYLSSIGCGMVITQSPSSHVRFLYSDCSPSFQEASFNTAFSSAEMYSGFQQYNPRDFIGLSNASGDNDLTGEGVTVAILDTGIYPDHAVFTDNFTVNWEDRIIAFYDEDVGDLTDTPTDLEWHGTWATSILGGNSSSYHGIAQNVNFVIMQVFYKEDNQITSDVDTINEAIDWILENQEEYDIKIASMSFGAQVTNDNVEEVKYFHEITERLSKNGILVVAAAGNNGDVSDASSTGTITAPASSPYVLAVGGVDEEGNMYERSGEGPTFEGITKPDVCAPAIDIKGAKSSNPTDYGSLTGTSASVPFVAGLAALMAEKEPEITSNEMKSIISLTCVKTINPGILQDNTQGWGLIQGYAALDALDNPIKVETDSTFEFSLDESEAVFCQPIELSSNHYFFELDTSQGGDAEIFIFDSKPDDYGNPISISHSLNTLNILTANKQVGVFTLVDHTYYLVVKLKDINSSGTYLIRLVFDSRMLFVFFLFGLNALSLVLIVKYYKISRIKKI